MADLFKEIIPSITMTKEPVLETEQDFKSYPSFMVNRALSYNACDIYIVNVLNQCPDLDNRLKYEFLLNTCVKGKRPFSKWSKPHTPDDLQYVKEYFGYSDKKAYEALDVLDDSQIELIRKRTSKGE